MKIIVTAGPTREHLDPVRFLSNPSTGKMGFALAEAAVKRGHDAILVAGPVSLKTPAGVKRVDVVSAREMSHAVKSEVVASLAQGAQTVVVGAAAVADWRPAVCSARKLKKSEMGGVLKLVRNPDILKSLRVFRKKGLKMVGFAAETGDPVAEASRKCREKGLSFVVGNDVSEAGSGFGVDTDRVVLVYPDGCEKRFPLMSKRQVAKSVVKAMEAL